MMRRANVCNGHYLVKTKVRLKMMKNEVKKSGIERFDVKHLNSVEIRKTSRTVSGVM